MSIYLKPILTACYVFPVLAALFTLPYIIRQYHKYGSILVLRTGLYTHLFLYDDFLFYDDSAASAN